MDLSGLIFVALALAWAAYLIPKALKHSDEAGRTRTIDRFSSSMRVLDRSARTAARSGSASSSASSGVVVEEIREEVVLTDAQQRRRRQAARVATRRRRRVLGMLLGVLGVVAVLTATSVLAWAWLTLPVGLLVAWLVACRVMVKNERAPMMRTVRVEQSGAARSATADDALAADDTSSVEAVPPADPNLWEPRQVPLPTYVGKARAPRAATGAIDFDDTGMHSSGHSAADSEIARSADARADDSTPRTRAVGS